MQFTPTSQPPRSTVRYCRHCGHGTRMQQPDGDGRERALCPACGTIHYVNPLIVTGTVPYWKDKILLCRRNIEPQKGKWTLPAGFMELGENPIEGAARETIEEAGATFQMGGLFGLMGVKHAGQVHIYYLCQLIDTQFQPGPETQEARLFAAHEIPWDELSFDTVRAMIRAYWADYQAGNGFQVHCHDFE